MAFDAFISHSSKDKAAADAACAVLEGAGVRCWIAPRDIRPGGEYGAAIIEAIDQCRVMVLIFSLSANDSHQIHREIERAVAKGVPIIPVRIEEVAPTKSMEYFLGGIHWLDALTAPIENHLQQLAQTVKAILQVNVQAGTAPIGNSPHKSFAQSQGRAPDGSKPSYGTTRMPVGKRWLFAAVGSTMGVAVLAVGVWLHYHRVGVPAAAPIPASPQAAPVPAPPQPAPKQAAAIGNWAGNWAGVWFVPDGKESTVAIAIKGTSIVGTILWRGLEDSQSNKHRADGTLFNCKVNGDVSNCELAWDYTDPGKDLKNHATGNLTLDGDHMTGEFHQDEAEPTWRGAPIQSRMHVGAVWHWDLVRRQ
jgi:hypothetical protein